MDGEGDFIVSLLFILHISLYDYLFNDLLFWQVGQFQQTS